MFSKKRFLFKSHLLLLIVASAVFSVTTYTRSDGLAHNNVTDIAVAADNTKWFATWGGVSSFDGTTWQTFTMQNGLEDNAIECIAIGPDNRIWAGSHNAVNMYDGSESWTSYTNSDGIGSQEHDIDLLYVRCIAVNSQGTVWAGTNYGAGEFGTGWTPYTMEEGLGWAEISAVATDNNGEPWIGFSWKGIQHYISGGSLYDTGNGLANIYVRTLAVDARDNKWIGDARGGLTKFDGIGFHTFTQSQGLPNNSVYDIAVGPNGNIWCATWGGGICRFDEIANSWATFNKEQSGLPKDTVAAVAIDSTGIVWTGNYYAGASSFNPNTIQVKKRMGKLLANASFITVHTIDNRINISFVPDKSEKVEIQIFTSDGSCIQSHTQKVMQSQKTGFISSPLVSGVYICKINASQKGLFTSTIMVAH